MECVKFLPKIVIICSKEKIMSKLCKLFFLVNIHVEKFDEIRKTLRQITDTYIPRVSQLVTDFFSFFDFKNTIFCD